MISRSMAANQRSAPAFLQSDRCRSQTSLRLRHGGMVLRTPKGARLDDRSCAGERRSYELARKAVHLGNDDPVALCMGGYALAFIAHEFDDGRDFHGSGAGS